MRRRWKRFRHRLEWLGLRLATALLPRLPRRWVARAAKGAGVLVFYLDRRGREMAEENLRAALGDQYDYAQRRCIARKSYSVFARTMCDLLGARQLNQENYRRYLKVENIEELAKLRARGENFVFLSAHQGNFEWAGLACGFEGYPTMVVAESLKNKTLGRFFQENRQVAGHQIIPQEGSMVRLLKRVKRGGVTGMLVDLNLRPHEAATVIEGFGMKMCVTFLHAVLALRGPARLVPVEGRSLPDGTCQVRFHAPLQIPADATYAQVAQLCWDFYEARIRAQPEEWLWAYRHWRYKPENATRPYPAYAQSDPAFEELLRKVAAPDAARPELPAKAG
jgi:KDO2-lipid IV(A) lauroyltransferase